MYYWAECSIDSKIFIETNNESNSDTEEVITETIDGEEMKRLQFVTVLDKDFYNPEQVVDDQANQR